MPLPDGVDLIGWEIERVRYQNPRIRYLLSAIGTIEEVLDSNYAILHCSSDRLSEVVRRGHTVADGIEKDLAPLLEPTSTVPKLEEALTMTRTTLDVLRGGALSDIANLTFDQDRSEQMAQRKLLSMSIGRLHAFLQDGFARIVSADPRSHHEIDYFLSKRFPNEIEEAEWLHYSVGELRDYLESLQELRDSSLTPLIERLRRDRAVPGKAAEETLLRFVQRMNDDFVPRLRALLTQRGIRYEEMEILDRYANEVPRLCAVATELWSAARDMHSRLKEIAGVPGARREDISDVFLIMQSELSSRLSTHLEGLDQRLRDFTSFVPFWLHGLEGRRALMLARTGLDGGVEARQPPAGGASRNARTDAR